MLMLNTTKLIAIFIICDDFVKNLGSYLDLSGQAALNSGKVCIQASPRMSVSEMMSIVIFYHLSGFKCFKYYYEQIICGVLKSWFPRAYSYTRFVYLMKGLNPLLLVFMLCCRTGRHTGTYYIDSKCLKVCHNKRIHSHQVFKDIAQRGKTSVDWFFGFKIHLIINEKGEIINFEITQGNKTDNNSELLQRLTAKLSGELYGDKGYLTKLKTTLQQQGLNLITKLRKNMKNNVLDAKQSYYLRKRALIESVFDMLKFHCDIEHSRHRSVFNFMSNTIAALIAYTFMDSLPSIMPYQKNRLENPSYQIVLI